MVCCHSPHWAFPSAAVTVVTGGGDASPQKSCEGNKLPSKYKHLIFNSECSNGQHQKRRGSPLTKLWQRANLPLPRRDSAVFYFLSVSLPSFCQCLLLLLARANALLYCSFVTWDGTVILISFCPS